MKWFLVGLMFYNGDPTEIAPILFDTRGNCEAARIHLTKMILSRPSSGALLLCKELPET